MHNFFLSVSFIVSVRARIFPLNMRDIIIYVARWWEKYLSKRSLLKRTCSWRVNLLYYEYWRGKQKYFYVYVWLFGNIMHARDKWPLITEIYYSFNAKHLSNLCEIILEKKDSWKNQLKTKLSEKQLNHFPAIVFTTFQRLTSKTLSGCCWSSTEVWKNQKQPS